MEFRENLLLIYFNSVQDTYHFQDIVEYLGITHQYASEMIERLLEQNYLTLNKQGVIIVTELALIELRSKGLDNIYFFDLYSHEELIKDKLRKKLSTDAIYIPKEFDKKFKGYKRK